MPSSKKRNWKAIVSFIIVLSILSLAYYFTLHTFNLSRFRDYVDSFGSLVPIVLLLIIIVTSSIGFIFIIPVAVTALLLNLYMAFAVSIIGLTTGAMLSFYLSRYLGRDYFEKRVINKIKRLKEYNKNLETKGFLTVFFLRLITLMPYELVNIAAGLSRIKPRHFFLATIVGIMPGTLITLYFVKSTNNIKSIQFLIATLLFTAFAILPLLSKKVRRTVFGD